MIYIYILYNGILFEIIIPNFHLFKRVVGYPKPKNTFMYYLLYFMYYLKIILRETV